MKKRKKIPYGETNFRRIREDNMYYVDKTRYISLFEDSASFFFFLRPRRFGKTLTLQMLSYYYDINHRDIWDSIFGDLWIGSHPTPLRSSLLVIKLDFQCVDGGLDGYRGGMDRYCGIVFDSFADRYAALLPCDFKAKINATDGAVPKLSLIIDVCTNHNLPLFIILDEYDHFTNDILSDATRLADYEAETHQEGYFRKFFNLLKSGSQSCIKKLFITGVSPVTMDDVTSGFNIGANYSTAPEFNHFMGFCESEVREILDYYAQFHPFNHTADQLLDFMRPLYDNYCFAKKCIDQERVFNSDMVFYFVDNYIRGGCDIPSDFIDPNVRSDYHKLRLLVRKDRGIVSGTEDVHGFSQNSSIIQTIVEEGGIKGNVVNSFPGCDVGKPENFVSLLYYMGMLSYSHIDDFGKTYLTIPNQVVREVMYGYMMRIYEEEGLARNGEKTEDLIAEMAFLGTFRPFFEYVTGLIADYSSHRDLQKGEAHIQGFLLGTLCQSQYYLPFSEAEMGKRKGFADLFLHPRVECYPKMRYAYIVEMKYAKHDATDADIRRLTADAVAQADRYAQSPAVTKAIATTKLIKLVCVWRGVTLEVCTEADKLSTKD